MYARRIADAWVELQPGRDIEIDGVLSSYQTMTLWTPQLRATRGIETIVDDAVPAGKVAIGNELIDDAGSPRRVWTLIDAPPPPIPDGPTLSDWRVALIQMGRFTEVKTAIETAKDSGAPEGLIAFERFEYANHVYRAELLRLAPVMGFTEADVDESLQVAAQVAQAAAA